MEISVLFMMFLFVFVAGNDDLRRIDAIKQEQPCRQAGGFCVISADCPEGLLSEERGLCPDQQKEGVECCYGVSLRETRCRKRGGDCVSGQEYNCQGSLRYLNPSDCNADEKCCIFV